METPRTPVPLPLSAKLLRFAAIGMLMLVAVACFAFVGGWLSPHRAGPAAIIDALHTVNGIHPGFRRNHAKGVCVSGYFDPTPEAAAFSAATVFEQTHVPVVGRFALAGGMPAMPDNVAAVRSMALRFMPSGAPEWRTGMNDIPVFVVNSAQGFYDQLRASTPDPKSGKPDPAAMQAFLAAHPETVRALDLLKQRPVSTGFANDTYNSLNAFRLVDSAGTAHPVRWSMLPAQAFVKADTGPRGDDNNNFLFDALIADVKAHPLSWHLVFTLGQAADATDDATIAWPADRRQVDAGIVTIDRAAGEDGGACTDINYDPLILPAGIQASDDPLLAARSAVYARSFTLRSGEKPAKAPSAVTPEEAKRSTP